MKKKNNIEGEFIRKEAFISEQASNGYLGTTPSNQGQSSHVRWFCVMMANKQILRTMVSIPFVFPNFHNRFVESPCFHNYLISANENKHSNCGRLLPVCAPRKHSCYLLSYEVAHAVRSYLPTKHSFYGSKILSLSLRVLYAINSRIFQLTSREQ